MAKHRLDRISEEVKKEVSAIIRSELKDPRISFMSTVVDAEVTPDLRYAKIFISVLGSEEEKQATIKGLNSAAGYVRKEVGERINLRHNPQIIFELDKSIEHGAHINRLISDIKKKEEGEDNW